jgi:hypothetical protein
VITEKRFQADVKGLRDKLLLEAREKLKKLLQEKDATTLALIRVQDEIAKKRANGTSFVINVFLIV